MLSKSQDSAFSSRLQKMPLSRWYRASILCGGVPALAGWTVFLLWLAMRRDFLLPVWYFTMYAAIVLFVSGVFCVALFLISEFRDGQASRGFLIKWALGSLGLLFASFPISSGLMVIAGSGCVATICPPHASGDQVQVVVVDYGRHSSLILPRPDGTYVEYVFGEWNWYARLRDRWYHVIPTVFWPTQGALGRRPRQLVPELGRNFHGENVIQVPVSRLRVEALLQKLDARFEMHIETKLYNRVYRFTFVKDDESYVCFNNCNHLVVRWLRDLGCTVTGSAGFANFPVESSP